MVARLAVIQQCPDNSDHVQCPGCGICLPQCYFYLYHRMPKADGGANDISHRILLCSPCNGDKVNTKALSGLHNDNLKEGNCQPGWNRKAFNARRKRVDDAVERLRRELT